MLTLLALLSVASAHPLDGLPGLYPELSGLYRDLHANPELSNQEVETSAKLAARMQALGFEVTEKVGGNGVVAVLHNGSGPTVWLRTDMDALPLEEKTGLAYASTTSVMHACGHDVHMTSWIGAATLLSRDRKAWKGTLVMIAQPAEELGSGAKAMIADGLFTRFPKPDVAFAIHDSGAYPAGSVGLVPGYAMANVDSVDITVFGRGGHGAAPHRTVDPVVLAARTVLSLQTLVSRETDPLKPAVVTVGSIHGGTKHNIISDEVKLQLTVRSYDDQVRADLLAGIARIAKAEALAANAPKEPEIRVDPGPSATYNEPSLAVALRPRLEKILGREQVLDGTPIMGAEDFSEFHRAGIPAFLIWVGAAPKGAVDFPSTHSSLFAPEEEPTLKTGTTALVTAALMGFGAK